MEDEVVQPKQRHNRKRPPSTRGTSQQMQDNIVAMQVNKLIKTRYMRAEQTNSVRGTPVSRRAGRKTKICHVLKWRERGRTAKGVVGLIVASSSSHPPCRPPTTR